MKKWEPSSWRDFRIKQLPEYPDKPTLARVLNELKTLPGLVPVKEILSLQEQLCEVADGKAILLQCGDCAESFAGYNENSVSDTLRVILQMALLLSLETKKPVVKMARMAGQFAKPRSEAQELQRGL